MKLYDFALAPNLFATVSFDIAPDTQNQTVTVNEYTYIGPISIDPGDDLYKHFPNFGTMGGKVIGVEVTAGTVAVLQPEE